MTKEKDCPQSSNEGLCASFLDAAEAEAVAALDGNALPKLMADWLAKLPADEAHNAARHHATNKRKLREAGSIIDEHRKTPEGRAIYNAKAREEYVPVGPVKRAYVTGLSDAEKAEHARKRNVAAQAKFRAGMTQADKEAAALRKREKRAAQKASETAAAEAALAARRIV